MKMTNSRRASGGPLLGRGPAVEKHCTRTFRWTHQRLVHADDVNLLGDNIDTIKKDTETLIDASKEVGLVASTEKTKYMLLSCHQNAGKYNDIKIDNRYFEIVAQFRYLGAIVTGTCCCLYK
jgi:hypothetical protein